MEDITIKCNVDGVGRVTIPHQYRKALHIEEFSCISMSLMNNGLFIYKENEEDILKRKINDIIDIAKDCAVLNGNEREELNKILSKLV